MKLRHYVYSPASVLSGYGTGAQQAAALKLAQGLKGKLPGAGMAMR